MFSSALVFIILSLGFANIILNKAEPTPVGYQPVSTASSSNEPVNATAEPSASATPEPAQVRPGEPLIGPFTIARVLSADTFDLVDSDLNVFRIRLIGIDSPAESNSTQSQQCGGSDALIAANYAFNYPNIQVMLEPDSAWPKTDELGSEYFYMWVDDELFTIDLLEDGNAIEYAKHGPYRHQEAHLAAQAMANGQASAGSVGIWRNCPGSMGAGFGTSSDEDSWSLAIIPFLVGDNEENYECHPSYIGTCLNPNTGDYNCGSMPLYVIGPDIYRLDGDNDGVACES
jgi:endonuclease YncB( thermonuclease family)